MNQQTLFQIEQDFSNEKFSIDFSLSKKCMKCGEIFIPIKSDICPVCWRKKFEMEGLK